MSLFRTMGRAEMRASDNGWTTFRDLFNTRVAAGVEVNQQTAMTLPVVYRCVALNSETIGALPVDALQKVGPNRVEIEPPAWVTDPNEDDTWQDLVTATQMSLETDGNAFLLKIVSGSRLVGLIVLAPTGVSIRRVQIDGRPQTVYQVALRDGGVQTFGRNEILHIRGLTRPGTYRGLSPIALMRESIGLGLAAQEFGARWFGDGAHMSGVIEMPTGVQPLKPDDEARLRDSFNRKHGGVRRSHALGILHGGAKYTTISVNAEESQFLRTQSVTGAQIALAFGVPPNYAVDAEGTKGYVTGVTAGKMMWLQMGLLTRIVRLENAFSSLMPRGYLKFNMRGFLRGDPKEEAAYLSAQKDRGVINANEWRELLDRNPVEGGAEYVNTLANFL